MSMANVVQRALEDSAFKTRLFTDPKTVLKENGVEVPSGVEIKVVQNDASRYHLILPPAPENAARIDELAERTVGAGPATKRWANVVAKAWKDSAFKKRLLDNPRAAVKELGMDIPENLDIRVLENTATVRYLVLPAAPSEELSEAELAAVAGGGVKGKVAKYAFEVTLAAVTISVDVCDDAVDFIGKNAGDFFEDVGNALDPTKW